MTELSRQAFTSKVSSLRSPLLHKTRTAFKPASLKPVPHTSTGNACPVYNADYLASLVPDVTVKAAPQAGWFYPEVPQATPASDGHFLKYSSKEATHTSENDPRAVPGLDELWARYINPACLAAYSTVTQWFCDSIHNQYKHTSTPLLVIEDQYYTNRIFVQALTPHRMTDPKVLDYIAYYGGLMRDSIVTQIQVHGQIKAKGKDGLFLPSCLDHAVCRSLTLKRPSSASSLPSPSTTADGVGYVELVGDWFFEKNKLASHMLIDNCKMADMDNPVQ